MALNTLPKSWSPSRPSRRWTAALNPRFMLVPWSPSPMAESSLVRAAACSSITAAVDLTQATAWATENTGYTPQRSAGVSTGASHSRVFSSSRRRMVTEAPCISSEVMYGPTRCRATCTPPSSSSCTTRR